MGVPTDLVGEDDIPAPISNSNSSVYDPSAQISTDADCDPSSATCAASASAASQPSTPPAVTIPEVRIDGDAGKQELLRRLEARSAPSRGAEAKEAALACAAAGAAALGGVATSTTGIGLVAGFSITLTASAYCGKQLRAVYDCE